MTDTAPSTQATAEPSPSSPATPQGKSLLARVIGVFVSPRATYADVAARPRWFGVMAISVVLIGSGFFAFLSTEVGRQALLDQQTRVIESFGVKLNDAAQEQMEAGIERAKYMTPASQVVAVPLVTAIFAGILLGIFNALLGGDASFKQVYAIIAHSGLITALQTVFSLPIEYMQETMSSPTNLGIFAPFLEENSFMARLLGSIDLFQIWGLLSLAIGLGVLYKRKTTPIATTLFIVYFVIVAVIAAIRTALS